MFPSGGGLQRRRQKAREGEFHERRWKQTSSNQTWIKNIPQRPGLRSGGWPHYRGQSWSRRRCSSTDICCAVAGSCPPRASRSITSMPSGRVSGFIRMRTTLRGSSRLLREPLKMPTGS